LLQHGCFGVAFIVVLASELYGLQPLAADPSTSRVSLTFAHEISGAGREPVDGSWATGAAAAEALALEREGRAARHGKRSRRKAA